jgi:hypothetical protein
LLIELGELDAEFFGPQIDAIFEETLKWVTNDTLESHILSQEFLFYLQISNLFSFSLIPTYQRDIMLQNYW